MATSQAVNLNVGSEFGFKRPVFAPVPIMETIKSFNTTTTITGTLANVSSRVLTISAPTDFVFPVGNTSTLQVLATYGTGTNEILKAWTNDTRKQNITITNVGNSPVTLFPRDPYRPTFSIPPPVLGLPGTYPVLHSAIGSYTLAAGASRNIELAYYGTDLGDYTSYLTIESTAGISTVTLFTNQIVMEETFDFLLSTNTFVVDSIELGRSETKTIDFIPVFNGIANAEASLNFTYSLEGDPGWSVTTGSNLVNITWDPDVVKNSTGTYTSILTISTDAASQIISNTSYVHIDYSKYRNLSSWLSPAASNNSVIGVTLDLFNDVKVLTIGVGVGADGTPEYADGGQQFAVLRTLGNGAGTIDTPYPYWANVCRIPLDNFPARYLSGELDENDVPKYMMKETEGLNYADYFGFEQGERSIFVVEHDGAGNVTIEINNLRELSGDATFDATLQNLTRAFHYYSTVDTPSRYYQLDNPIIDGTLTQLFRGFSTYYDPIQKWSVETSIVPLPTQ